MKECQVANFHGQASGAYACLNDARKFIFMVNNLKPIMAYTGQMQGSLFSWTTS
jgi:hypothetical protein